MNLNLLSFFSSFYKIISFEFTKYDFIHKKLINIFASIDNQKKSKGVYLIYGVKNKKKELIYIGKAGTINNKGNYKIQGFDRLKKKRGKIYSQQWFLEIIEKYGYEKLLFKIIVLNNKTKLTPAFLESFLLQKYYEKCNKLPLLNKAF